MEYEHSRETERPYLKAFLGRAAAYGVGGAALLGVAEGASQLLSGQPILTPDFAVGELAGLAIGGGIIGLLHAKFDS
jgi:hypothetical protein